MKLKRYKDFIRVNEFVSNYPYRVYKKTKDYYRIEERVGNNWEEIETDKNIENLLLTDCFLSVNERGREQTIGGHFKSSEDVPVHAWIECKEYEIGGQLDTPDGILYYNPFTVKKFTDRDSYESGEPEVINRCSLIGIKGNYLEYSGAKVKIKDMGALVKKELVSESMMYYNMIYSPIIENFDYDLDSSDYDSYNHRDMLMYIDEGLGLNSLEFINDFTTYEFRSNGKSIKDVLDSYRKYLIDQDPENGFLKVSEDRINGLVKDYMSSVKVNHDDYPSITDLWDVTR